MSASTVDNAVVVTITSATTATTTDGIEFSAINGAELQEQILDYAHHLAASDDQPVLLELRNPATGRGDVIEMTPSGAWEPAHADDPEPEHPEVAPGESSTASPVEMPEPPIADDNWDAGDRSGGSASPSTAAAPPATPMTQPAADEAVDQSGVVETAVEQDSPWRGTTPGHLSVNARPRPASANERRSRGAHVPPPAGGRLRTVWQRHRMPVMVIGLIALVAVVGLGVIAGRLFGASTVDSAPTDPAAAMAPAATADPTSDEVECPSRTTGALTTGRDPGNQTSGPNAIKAFNYGYYKWRSGNAARAVVSSNAKVGTAITLQRYIDTLDPNLRYCLAITEKSKGPGATTLYDVEHTLIPSTGGDRQTFRQDITTTVIGGKYWISEIDSK
ncbi:hypothetical protein [Gordonia sp. OPL2]|uniref:hypothetical protein n=1 Tax=Gordonia sp. OPL2 TaxID=2486274 RepID=UPI001655AD49|nr:hypothetical protein [Gordonia sp. OPL2]ROZ88100.1 hypothetical protein EEB19_22455 [Gordonia sp. OPL2]